MSFGLPPIKVKPEVAPDMGLRNGNYEIPNLMVSGFASVKSNLEVPHPLIISERNYAKNREQMDLTMMRNTQGLHAPLRYTMECKAAQKVGHLPILQSSHVMLDTLKGRDIEIGPEDIFNTAEFREYSGQPHAVIEKSLGIL